MSDITYNSLKKFFESNNYEVREECYVSGGFTEKFLDSLEFKFEASGEYSNQNYSIFIGKEKEGWFLDIEETRIFWLATITTMEEMLFLFKIFNILEKK